MEVVDRGHSGLPHAPYPRAHLAAERFNRFSTPRTTLYFYILRFKAWRARFSELRSEYGLLAALLLTFFLQDVLSLMEKINRDVLPGDDARVMSFMDGQTSSLSMIALAGAIIAQVATTALSLTRLGDSHWTSEAFFIMSLVCGILSVFFACVMHPSVRGLFSATKIRYWLSKPIPASQKSLFLSQLRYIEIVMLLPDLTKPETPSTNKHNIDTNKNDNNNTIDTETATYFLHDLEERIAAERWKLASYYAALMLVVPSRLLTLSLSCFVVGLGIYIGKLYASNLIPAYGIGSLWIQIVFNANVGIALAAFYIPSLMKRGESSVEERLEELVRVAGMGSAKGGGMDGAKDLPGGGTGSILRANPPHVRSSDSLPPLADACGIANELVLAKVYKADSDSDSSHSHSHFTPPPSPKINPARSMLPATIETETKTSNANTKSLDITALEDLLKAQQESVDACRRLLEIYMQRGEESSD